VKEYLNWSQFEQALCQLTLDYKQHDRQCVAILGIPRGGMVLATCLSYRLNIPLIQRLSDRPRLGDVLVVDDIADTGKTLKIFTNKQTIIYTLYYHKNSIVVPDCWAYEKTDKWIVYPWETDIKIKLRDLWKKLL
tara:strand:+ start:5378 stop:5782 length:405 start_codon:yes stop_codon:yes gene_type:complete